MVLHRSVLQLQAFGEVRYGLFYDDQLLGMFSQLALEPSIFHQKSFFHGAFILCKTSTSPPVVQLAFMKPIVWLLPQLQAVQSGPMIPTCTAGNTFTCPCLIGFSLSSNTSFKGIHPLNRMSFNNRQDHKTVFFKVP